MISVNEPLLDGNEENIWPRVSWRALVIDRTRAVERPNAWHYGSLLNLPEVQRVDLEDFAERPATTLGLRLIQLLIGDVRQCGHAGSSVRGGVKPAIALLGKTNRLVALYFYRALLIGINHHRGNVFDRSVERAAPRARPES